MSTFRRRMMMGGGRNELPEGYTAVDWIQSDGVAYINTGLTTKAELTLVIDMVYPKSANNKNIFGWKDGIVSHEQSICGKSVNGAVYIRYNSYGATGDVISDGLRAVYKAQMKNGSQVLTMSRNGQILSTKTGSVASTNFVEGKQIRIDNNPLYKGYGFEVYSDFDATIKTFEGIPCQRDSDGQYGVFDMVTKQFFGNAASSGAFTGGYD